jgi:hypothetical protein
MYNHSGNPIAAIDSTEANMMFLPSKTADLAHAEYKARRALDAANRTGDLNLIRKRTLALARAEKARREG